MIGNKNQIIVWLTKQSEDIIFEIKQFIEKRSKSQNSYYWVLLSKLAGAIGTSKEELHEELIRRYADRDYVSLLANVNPNKYFKYYDEQGTFKKNDNTFKSYIIYQRSSEMNKTEFRNLLDGLISECEEVGIATLTKNAIDEMIYIENSKR